MTSPLPCGYDPLHPFPPLPPYKPFGLDITPNHEERKFRLLCTRPRRRVMTERQEKQLILHGRFFRLDECCGGHEST